MIVSTIRRVLSTAEILVLLFQVVRQMRWYERHMEARRLRDRAARRAAFGLSPRRD
jgi:hypothetical protein